MKKIIAISSKQGGGKSTLAANLLTHLPNAVVMKFAQPLYDILKLVKTDIIQQTLLYPGGKLRVSSLIELVLTYFERFQIDAENEKVRSKLYEVLKVYIQSIDAQNISIEKITNEDGVLLQKLGTEVGRDLIDTDVWAKICKFKCDNSKHDYIIIDDMRFENEFDIFPDALKIRLECPEEVRKVRCEKWRPDVNHPSEIGLDQYALEGKFDLTFDTENQNVVDIINRIKELVI